MKTHKKGREKSSSAFQVAASGHGSPFSNNPSKCCPVVSRNLKTDVQALTLVLVKYYSLSTRTSQEGQLQCALDEFPCTTATKIAQACCALLEIWQRGLRKSPVFPICIALILPFFSFPRRCSSSSAISVTKACFSSASQSAARRLFFFWRKGSALYLEIITPQWNCVYSGFLLLGACEE